VKRDRDNHPISVVSVVLVVAIVPPGRRRVAACRERRS
jgi:hypothetical protein